MERRLTAILAADVVGYSRLMEADEEATVRALRASRRIIDTCVAAHGGRVFGSAGDSVIAEFPSPVEAVYCAVDIQRALESRDTDMAPDRRMRLRIGINLGDVIVEGDNLFGDGVNIAARLERLADPGGINLSGPVFDQLKKHLDLGYEYLGKHKVKNIAEPIRVYRVLTAPEAAGKIISRPAWTKPAWRWRAAAAVLVIVAAAGGAMWLKPWSPAIEPASVERMAFPLPDKPSIAVLPFGNLSDDPGQDHIADGLTKDIILALSQVSRLFVISHNSAFVYRGKPHKVQQVAEELGVRYVLEGSVRTSGDKVRVVAQLVDALNGNHLWAERYDRELTDVFALQDEITEHIVTSLQIELTAGEQIRVHRKHTRSLTAWNLVGKGTAHFYRSTKTDNTEARQWFAQAIDADPEYALAYALVAWTHWLDAFHGWSEDAETSFRHASVLADKAISLDADLPDVHALKGAIHLFRREYDKAVEAAEKAVAQNPNHANNSALLALILHNAGRPQEAIARYKTAMRLSPYYPAWYLEDLGFSYLEAGQFDEALLAFEKFLDREPSSIHVAHAHVGRALAYHLQGRYGEARTEVAKAIEADSNIGLRHLAQLFLAKDREALERGLVILRHLGLPE